MQKELQEIEQRWINIFTSISKSGVMSYAEIKRLSVFEFFHIFNNHIAEIKNK